MPTLGGVSDIAGDIREEHRRAAATLDSVGPDAPSGVDGWTAADLAAHLLSQVVNGGVVMYVGRRLVARGVHLNERSGSAVDRALQHYKRKGFDFAVRRIQTGPPRILLRGAVAPVTLFEIWVHHDDLRRANGLEPPEEPPSLGQAVEFALRYHERDLGDAVVDRPVSDAELLRWLAGRPSTLPPHDPPLRF